MTMDLKKFCHKDAAYASISKVAVFAKDGKKVSVATNGQSLVEYTEQHNGPDYQDAAGFPDYTRIFPSASASARRTTYWEGSIAASDRKDAKVAMEKSKQDRREAVERAKCAVQRAQEVLKTAPAGSGAKRKAKLDLAEQQKALDAARGHVMMADLRLILVGVAGDVWVNPQYLYDILGTGVTHVTVYDPLEPIVFTGPNVRALLMPMRRD